ncbi:MATE family efflux transporter [Shouchella clausii]|nr:MULTISPECIES: MATE family efflux transporter [Shouchella]MBX0317428.1 MATE family efflux transporter [Shouchella clausii]PAE91827.1 MATE family efflux transporter [Shouchella clausii]GIN08387.1 MATE family efflux transporter [Shouchella clausii]SHL86666.1 putative efflux protein, MATE family [Shouchella rhizosphaerae]
MKQTNNSTKLGNEPIGKLLRDLSVPAMIGMFVMAFYNVVDVLFISYGVGIEAVAGLTIAFPVMMIMMAVSAAVGIGGASVISRRLGENRHEDANRVFGTVLALIVVMSVAGLITALFFLDDLLVLFGATPDILPYSYDYMFPIMLGTVFFAFTFATNNIIRSEGNARFAMVTMVIPAILNIILDPIFIFALDMGVKGAGVATVVAQGAVSFFILRYYVKGESSLRLSWTSVSLRFSVVKEILSVGFPAFVQQASGSLMMIAINAMLIQHGSDMHVGVFGIIQRIMMFTVMPMIGVMQGMMPIVGYNYGAKQFARMRETIWLTLKVVVACSIGVVFIMMAFPALSMRIFTTDPLAIETGTTAMRIMFAGFFLAGVQVVAGGLYQALGKPIPALILSLSRQIIFLIPLVLLLPQYMGITGVFLAFPIADLLSFILATFLLYRDRDTILVIGKQEQQGV